jgi:hypothetical protein
MHRSLHPGVVNSRRDRISGQVITCVSHQHGRQLLPIHPHGRLDKASAHFLLQLWLSHGPGVFVKQIDPIGFRQFDDSRLYTSRTADTGSGIP